MKKLFDYARTITFVFILFRAVVYMVYYIIRGVKSASRWAGDHYQRIQENKKNCNRRRSQHIFIA